MSLVNPSWMPNCSMKRVICHWTAGQYRASPLDREHYHILIEADGGLIRGRRSIADNVSTSDRIYAAHTLNCNTGSIGIAVCCMAGAHERPYDSGHFPMTPKQWHVMCQVTAELCRFYRIPVTPTTVLGHGEVEINLGVKQKGKWDPMILPWNQDMSRIEVGTAMRSLVQNELEGAHPIEDSGEVAVVVSGQKVGNAFMTNGSTWADLDDVAAFLRWTANEDDKGVVFSGDSSPDVAVPVMELNGRTYVDIEDLAGKMGRNLSWNSRKRVVSVA
jgi:hypothetical protein